VKQARGEHGHEESTTTWSKRTTTHILQTKEIIAHACALKTKTYVYPPGAIVAAAGRGADTTGLAAAADDGAADDTSWGCCITCGRAGTGEGCWCCFTAGAATRACPQSAIM